MVSTNTMIESFWIQVLYLRIAMCRWYNYNPQSDLIRLMGILLFFCFIWFKIFGGENLQVQSAC